MKDKNGQEIDMGDDVKVFEGTASPLNICDFVGEVVQIYSDNTICVVDQDDNYWNVEANLVEVQ